MALASVLFSAMSVFARLAAGHASWAAAASVRAWVGVAVAYLVARAAGHALRVENQRVAWLRSLCGLGGMTCSFYTMASPDIALGDIATLRATGPILIAVLAAWLLRERPPSTVYMAVPVAFLGIIVLVRPSFQTSGELAVIAFLGAVFGAFAMLNLRRLGPTESPEAVAIHFGVIAGVALGIVALFDGRWPDAQGMVWMFAAGLSGGLGQLFMTRAYAVETAALVSAVGYLAVVCTHVAAYLVLDEPLDGARGLGAALVVLGGWVLVAGRLRERATRLSDRQPPSRVRAI